MELEFLGTGTSQGVPVITCDCAVCSSNDPKDRRLRSSVLVRDGERTLLVDAGPDMRAQMLRAGVRSLDAVLITHEHMDHIAGVDDLRAFNFSQNKPMDIYATEATNTSLRRVFHYAFGNNKYPGVPKLQLHTITNSPFSIGTTTVLPIEVMHYRMPVLGFRFGDICYITDAKTINEQEKEKMKGAKVLVLNALRKEEHISHFNLDEALELVEELAPKEAYFTHISHLLGTHADISKELPMNVHLAFDGLVVDDV